MRTVDRPAMTPAFGFEVIDGALRSETWLDGLVRAVGVDDSLTPVHAASTVRTAGCAPCDFVCHEGDRKEGTPLHDSVDSVARVPAPC